MASESEKFDVQPIEKTGVKYAIDEYGFYITSEDQTPAPTEYLVDAVHRDAAERDWWKNVIRGFFALCDGEEARQPGSPTAPSSSLILEQSTVGHRLREKLLKGMRNRIHQNCDSRPSRVRRLIWRFFAGVSRSVQDKSYQSLLTISIPAEVHEVIQRDLPRTFPIHCLFLTPDSIGQQALWRVLHAYCVLDDEVGYCQGMGFVVAVLLLHMTEEEAFSVFVQMMQGKQFMMRQLYLTGFPMLQQFFVILRGLSRQLLPVLAEHFEEINVDVSFFAAQWFLTLFAYQLSLPLVCGIWDLFFSTGWKAIFQVAIALLQWDQHLLLRMRMEEVLMHLKNVHEGKSTCEVLRHARDVPILLGDLQIEKILWHVL